MQILWFLYLNVYLSSYHSFFTYALIGSDVKLATSEQFGFIVSLVSESERIPINNDLGHFCGGSLITRKHILTTAHCLEGYDKNITVIVGSHNLRFGQKYQIESSITYNEWAEDNNKIIETQDNDIAIIILSKCVSFRMKLGRITTGTNPDFYALTAETAGWGMTSGLVSQSLRTASLRVLPHGDCEANIKSTFGNDSYLPRRLLCTQANPVVLLNCGDSGGPLIIHDNEIIGINESICLKNDIIDPYKIQNIHVGIDYYRQFINEIIKEGPSLCCF